MSDCLEKPKQKTQLTKEEAELMRALCELSKCINCAANTIRAQRIATHGIQPVYEESLYDRFERWWMGDY